LKKSVRKKKGLGGTYFRVERNPVYAPSWGEKTLKRTKKCWGFNGEGKVEVCGKVVGKREFR